jgi:hypothetical protein
MPVGWEETKPRGETRVGRRTVLERLDRRTVMLISTDRDEWEWLRSMLRESVEGRVTADVSDSEDAIHVAARLRPDVVIVGPPR